MQEILILSFGFDGENSNNPNAICLFELINDLAKNNKIHVFTTTEQSKVFISSENNIKTYYIPITKKRNHKWDFKKWGKEVIEFISKRVDVHKISTLFTISFPFSIQQTGLEIKKKYSFLRWVIYELDPYAYNLVLKYPKLLFYYRYSQENKVFHNADIIMLTHELFNQYSQKSFFLKYKFKFVNIGIPIMKTNNIKNMSSKKICKVVYTGSFYNKIRKPEYMLNLLGVVANSVGNFQLHLYGPSPSSVSSKYKDIFKEKLYLHGRVSKKQVKSALSEANVLINIGNSVNNQLPSKVLEYIGMGKPIINFYSIPDDTSNQYLEHYPLALLLEQNNEITNEDVNKVIEFIEDSKNKQISNELISKLYKEDTIDAVKRKIVSILS